jgi:predicted dehydrogenase
MIKVGVVGAGIWGTMHARAYTQNPLVEIVAICDLDEGRAQSVSKQYHIPKVFMDVDEMLEEDLDGISVATPDDAHTSIVLKAAAKGIHILVDKPLATTVEECVAMVDAAENAGVFLMVD